MNILRVLLIGGNCESFDNIGSVKKNKIQPLTLVDAGTHADLFNM